MSSGFLEELAFMIPLNDKQCKPMERRERQFPGASEDRGGVYSPTILNVSDLRS